MARRYIKKEDREEMGYEGVMRLVEGIVLHVLDAVSISNKWYPRDISMGTLLIKKQKLNEMRIWMRGWQWSIWVNLYAQHNRYSSHLIKRRFESIRKKSIHYVNKRIYEKNIQNQNTEGAIGQDDNPGKDGFQKTETEN